MSTYLMYIFIYMNDFSLFDFNFYQDKIQGLLYIHFYPLFS